MNNSRGNRYKNIVGFIVILMLILAIRLFVLTIIQHDKWSDSASEQNTKTIFTPAPRGNIYDRNGNVMATTKQIFTATFKASGLSTEQINDSALAFIDKLQADGDKYKDDFPIKISSDGKFYYTYDQDVDEWLRDNGFPLGTTPEQVLEKKRSEYGIDPDLDRYEAMDQLAEKYRVSLPINPKTMKFSYTQEKENFWKKFGFKDDQIKKGISAKKCFEELRKKYKIKKSLSDEDARKIFIVRNEIATNGFTRYVPITIGTNISKKSVIYFEEIGIPGVEVSSSSERVYPNNNAACHVLGYMGAISENEAKEYVKNKGYASTDLVGKSGIESAMEDKLHGTPGMKKVKVNSSGEYVSTISDKAPKKGKDVYLTIDMPLQLAAESALKDAIQKSPHSGSGAAVAVDVKTGDVLALASYPDFDLNMFADGISGDEWKKVQPTNKRDNLAPAPLYNNATMTSVAPGSTFKPVTSFAALKAGLDPNRTIVDRGHIDLGGRSFGCDLWNNGGGTHGAENLEWGIGNSCNYYFYCIATNKDWGTGASLGYKEDMTVEKILDMAKRFGLGSKTNIEIGEVVTPMASKQMKLDNYRYAAWEAIYENAYTYFPENIYNDPDKLNKQISTIANLIDENPSYDKLVKIIKEKTDVKADEVDNLATMVKFDYFNQATWTTADAFNVSIGQGDNNYTPVQMARYVAAIADHAKKNDLSLIYGVQGEGKKVKPEAQDIGVSESDWEAVVKGMKRVCSSGTLANLYSNYPITVAGKTGTAENQGIKQPADEVKYIKEHLGSINKASGSDVTWEQVEAQMKEMMLKEPEKYPTENDTVDAALIKASNHKVKYSAINSGKGGYESFAWTMVFAPADDPQIAVVVMLVEGGYSSNAAPVTKAILNQYFGLDKNSNSEDKNKEKENSYVKITNNGANVVQ